MNDLLSVIIIAYDRREFVLSALESVEKQTLAKDKFEIVLVKNFLDQKTDSFCNEHKIKVFNTDAKVPSGNYVNLGLAESEGDIICILDDDDLFVESKLKKVYELFKSNPELAYYHNAFREFNGNTYVAKSGKQNERLEIVNLNEGTKIFTKLKLSKSIDARGDVNNSSICIRRSYFPKLNGVLDNSRSVDIALFTASLDSRKTIIFDSDKLTLVRNHPSFSKFSGTEENIISRAVEYNVNTIRDYKRLRKFISSGFGNKYLESNILAAKINSHTIAGKRPDVRLYELLKFPFSFRYIRKKFYILTFGSLIVGLIFPKLNRRIFTRYYTSTLAP